jgi:acetolactate synthase-1/3 small subunit
MNRIMSLFRQRGFNVDSIAVGHSEIAGMSRITLGVTGDEREIEQLTKQLYKLLEVVKVADVSGENLIHRELALVKLAATERTRGDIMRLVSEVFRARVVDAAPDTVVIEVTGPSEKIDSLIALVRPYGIQEIARTGAVAMVRGSGAVATTREEALA